LAQGSVVNITGTDTQTAGTLTPSYHLLRLDPSLRSTGSSIFLNVQNSIAAAPTNGHFYMVFGNTQTVEMRGINLQSGTSTATHKVLNINSTATGGQQNDIYLRMY